MSRALWLASLSLVAAVPAAAQDVTTRDGKVRGATEAGIEVFKGLPFAAPPVGELRWRAPQPVAPWADVRDATRPGHDCMRPAADPAFEPSEDCLTLNVWRPAGAQKGKLPVLVWIHGGAFVSGSNVPPEASGAPFARDGVIFVAPNYRLGRFGFFAHPALSAEHAYEPKGNYGYLDQIAALQWVQRNIAAFGGDPANVTITGASAGGESVLALAASPLARGLFGRVVAQSGGGRTQLLGAQKLAEDSKAHPSAEKIGVAFAASVGVEGSDAAALAQLRALPAEKVAGNLTALGMLFLGERKRFSGPIVDGRIVTAQPAEALKAAPPLPTIVGADEADLGLNRAPDKDAAFAAFGPHAAQARSAYDPDGTATLADINDMIGRDRTMIEPARLVARTIAAKGKPAWLFRFSYVAASLRGKPIKGAEHSSEVVYAFDTLSALLGDKLTAQDSAVASAMHGYWVQFAKTGNPNGGGLPDWPAVTPKDDPLLDFQSDGTPRAKRDPWQARLDATEANAAGGE
ncbi:Carboxylesterase, type B precursor [Sphingopyxis sp. LC81]|uniref:carboxylesterase/lipase family protein n=1 Tax=Sphingopyxis sp. LC81 TaxID=1502850 RepID=UPI00050E1A91|nr:carboxylesterase family protein [Sphingopyxis sp. LC81]KGB53084.1 Carboxylesterase, type B precursor [Sphingopyxis sp. LC81]